MALSLAGDRPLLATLARLSPLLGFCIGVLTYVVCVAYALGSGQYIGGIGWPYFSDTGREAPMYYLFAIGLTVTAVLLGVTNVSWFAKVHVESSSPAEVGRAILRCCVDRPATTVAHAALISVLVSLIGLVMLACFSTIVYPAVHDYSAYAFFILQTVALALYTVANNLEPPPEPRLRRARVVRNCVSAVYFACFIVYLPIGLAVNCPFERLSMDACVNVERLGEAYCAALQLPADPELTRLWDYSACRGTNEMRSVTQFLCIVGLLAYYVTFMLDLADEHELRVLPPVDLENAKS
jgi:hypothetical protein